MQTSNKFKPLKRCGCRACRHYSKDKQFAYRQSRRQFRKDGKSKLDQLPSLIPQLIDLSDDLVFSLISSDYTD